MPRNHWKKGLHLPRLPKSFHAFRLLFVLIFFSCLSTLLFAQGTTVIPRENPETIIERIRLYYGLKEYQQVLLECYKLEQNDPGNKMANYYKIRAESRLAEMGIPTPTPPPIAPVVTPQITPMVTPLVTTVAPVPTTVAPIPTMVAPVQTRPAELPEFPGMTTAAPTPRSTSPFLPSETAGETPVPAVTSVVEITPAPAETLVPSDLSPEITPEPGVETASSPIDKFKKFQESNPLMFFGILAAFLILAALIILLIIILFRKISMKKRIAKLEKMTTEAREKMAETIPMKQDLAGEMPAAPPEAPGFDFQVPDLPTPETLDFQVTPSPMPEGVAPDLPQPPIPEVAEPADIPSPSTFDQVAPIPESDPGLPDILSPTAPPPVKPHPALDNDQEFPGLPDDLPTFQEAFEAPLVPAPSTEELELPAFSFDEEKPLPEAPQLEIPTEENPLAFDLPPVQNESPAPPASIEDLFLESAPIGSEDEKKPDVLDILKEPPFPPASLGSEQDQAPAISIEDALGFGESPKTPPDVILVPSQENVPISPNDPGATSMDLDSFLFDVTNEDNAETILDIGGKGRQDTPLEPEPVSLELEGDSGIKHEDIGEIIFDEKSLAETKIKKPEPKSQPFFAPASNEARDLLSPGREHIRKEPEEKSPFFSPLAHQMEEKTAVKPPSTVTTKRMENILPFDREERDNHGLHPSKKPDRNETLFQEQFQKGKNAFDQGDWKKAVYYLTVASAIKPDAEDLKDMLSTAREKKRSAK